jgi:hypothetical protein
MRAWAALAIGGVLHAIVTAWAVSRLPPDGVPLQFGSDGTANRVGARSEVLMISAVPGVVVLGLGIGLVLLARYGPLRALNIPHRAYWLAEGRQPEVRRMLATDMALVMGATLVFLSLIPLWIVLGAEGGGDALSPLVFWVPIGTYVAAVLIWSVWLSRYRYRPRPR